MLKLDPGAGEAAQSQQLVTISKWDPKQVALLAELEQLERRLFPKSASWGKELGPQVSRRNTFLLVAHVEQPAAERVLAGYLVFTTSGLVAHISKLATVPNWRRQGIGRQLVRAVLATARQRRIASVSLHVDASNEAALGLYTSEGFCLDGCLTDYYAPGRHAHKMRLELDAA